MLEAAAGAEQPLRPSETLMFIALLYFSTERALHVAGRDQHA